MSIIQSKFEAACILGDISQVKEIVNIKEFIEQTGISYCYSTGVYQAVDRNHLDLIKYLLEECELKHHVSINFENNCILKTAARQNYFEIINYLVLEYDMKLTTDILMPNFENCDYVAELVSKRGLRKSLNVELQKQGQKEERKKLKL